MSLFHVVQGTAEIAGRLVYWPDQAGCLKNIKVPGVSERHVEQGESTEHAGVEGHGHAADGRRQLKSKQPLQQGAFQRPEKQAR